MVMPDETISLQECWHRLASQLGLTQESIVDHKPLVDWLRAACTIGTDGHPANISDTPPYPYPLKHGLDQHRANILRVDLPGLFPKTEGAFPGTREVVGAINNLTEEQRASREEANLRQARSIEKRPATLLH
jgi:hypothetical protein